jgi:hypothetical protein
LEILQEQVKRREAKIIELEREAALLKDQKTILELDVSHWNSHRRVSNLYQQQSKALPLEQIMDNPHYKVALEHVTSSTALLESKQEQIQKHTDELVQLYSFRREWEDNVTVGFAIRPKVTNLVYSLVERCHPGYSGAQSHACQARFGKRSIKGATWTAKCGIERAEAERRR